MVYKCTKSNCNSVPRVSHVSRVSHVLPKTSGEQKLVVLSWSDACLIAGWLELSTVAMYIYLRQSNGVN